MNELVSTHGYSQNQIMVWKYPSMAKVAYELFPLFSIVVYESFSTIILLLHLLQKH